MRSAPAPWFRKRLSRRKCHPELYETKNFSSKVELSSLWRRGVASKSIYKTWGFSPIVALGSKEQDLVPRCHAQPDRQFFIPAQAGIFCKFFYHFFLLISFLSHLVSSSSAGRFSLYFCTKSDSSIPAVVYSTSSLPALVHIKMPTGGLSLFSITFFL